MISTQFKKYLVILASTLSALGLMVLVPQIAIAQTSGQTQTGVEGSQINPDSDSGTGQVVPPPDTAEEMPGMMAPETVSPGMGVGSEESDIDYDMNSDTNSEGIEAEGVESDDMNSDGMETESDMTQPGSITVPNSNMPSNTVPTTRTTPSTTAPSTTTPTTSSPSPANTSSPRALW